MRARKRGIDSRRLEIRARTRKRASPARRYIPLTKASIFANASPISSTHHNSGW